MNSSLTLDIFDLKPHQLNGFELNQSATLLFEDFRSLFEFYLSTKFNVTSFDKINILAYTEKSSKDEWTLLIKMSSTSCDFSSECQPRLTERILFRIKCENADQIQSTGSISTLILSLKYSYQKILVNQNFCLFCARFRVGFFIHIKYFANRLDKSFVSFNAHSGDGLIRNGDIQVNKKKERKDIKSSLSDKEI